MQACSSLIGLPCHTGPWRPAPNPPTDVSRLRCTIRFKQLLIPTSNSGSCVLCCRSMARLDFTTQTSQRVRQLSTSSISFSLANTLQETHVIVYTVAATAKVKLINGFDPTVVYVDKSVWLSGLKNLILLSVYNPRAFILAVDYK